MRAAGYGDRAKELRKKWRKLTAEYKIYSLENNVPYHMYRCMVDETEIAVSVNTLQKQNESDTINMQDFVEVTSSDNTIEETTKDLWENDLQPRGQVEIPTGVTTTQFIQQELGVSQEKAIAYNLSLGSFTATSYSVIRQFQCGEKVDNEERIKKLVDDLEEYVQKAPRWNSGETYRGIGLTKDELSVYKVGYMFSMRGMASWSDKLEIAFAFADRNNNGKAVIFHCNTQNKGTAIAHLSEVEDESEVLVSNAARYMVRKIEESYGYVHIYVEEI